VLVFVISHGGTHIDISFVFVQNAANRNTIYARISFMLGASRATSEFATQRQTPWR